MCCRCARMLLLCVCVLLLSLLLCLQIGLTFCQIEMKFITRYAFVGSARPLDKFSNCLQQQQQQQQRRQQQQLPQQQHASKT